MKPFDPCNPDLQSLVVDIGSYSTKCGFSGDDAHRYEFPTVVGHSNESNDECYVGYEAFLRRGRGENIELYHVLDRGLQRKDSHPKDVERIFDHAFFKLQVAPKEHPILVTEPTVNRKKDREKLTSILFEKFQVPALYIGSQATLAIYSCGKPRGISLGVGHGFSTSVPIYDGHPVTHAAKRSNIGGLDISIQLLKLLKRRKDEILPCGEDKIDTDSFAFREIFVRDHLKERLSYISLDYKGEVVKDSERSRSDRVDNNFFQLPDGSRINLSQIKSERFLAPEILFHPNLIIDSEENENNLTPIHQLIQSSIEKTDEMIHRDLYSNISIFGGSTMFDGFSERLLKEVQCLEPSRRRIKIISSPERKFGVWIGGSILSSLSIFQDLWISKDGDYDEFGPSIVHRKCFGFVEYIEYPKIQKDVHGDEKMRIKFLIDCKNFCSTRICFFLDDSKTQRKELSLCRIFL